MKEKPVVAGIGELLWDVLPSGKQLGGAPCNFAFHAMQMGCESYILSAIGNDTLGFELKNELQDLNISVKYVQENEFPTSTVTVRLDDNAIPDYTIHENVAWDHIRWTDDMTMLAAKLDAICFGSLSLRNPESKNTIEVFIESLNQNCLKVFDINLRQAFYSKELILKLLGNTDVFKLNENELPVVAQFLGLNGSVESQLEKLLARFNLKYIVYTMGEKGSMVKSTSETSVEQAPDVLVADTVGAGDSFTAIFVSGILQGIPLKLVHRKATEIAAFICSQKGATPILPFKSF